MRPSSEVMPYFIESDDPETAEAVRRWNDGEPYMVSTDINDNETYGYGELDSLGYWEHPFPTDVANLDIVKAENRIRWSRIYDN